jgi:hypothetical protein
VVVRGEDRSALCLGHPCALSPIVFRVDVSVGRAKAVLGDPLELLDEDLDGTVERGGAPTDLLHSITGLLAEARREVW